MIDASRWHSDTPHAVELLWTSDQPVAETSTSDTPHAVELLWTSDQPVAETSTWQHTTLTETEIDAPDGIRARNPSKRAAADPCLRPRGHWDRPRLIVAKFIVTNPTDYSLCLFFVTLLIFAMLVFITRLMSVTLNFNICKTVLFVLSYG
jgi:hypothetical protein